MTISIDDLKAAWEGAEDCEPDALRVGDTIITRFKEGEYGVATFTGGGLRPSWETRILERAPKPEPRPRAVMARSLEEDFGDEYLGPLEVFAETASGMWESPTLVISTDELVDPIEMVPMPSGESLVSAVAEVYRSHAGWPGAGAIAMRVTELLKEGAA